MCNLQIFSFILYVAIFHSMVVSFNAWEPSLDAVTSWLGRRWLRGAPDAWRYYLPAQGHGHTDISIYSPGCIPALVHQILWEWDLCILQHPFPRSLGPKLYSVLDKVSCGSGKLEFTVQIKMTSCSKSWSCFYLSSRITDMYHHTWIAICIFIYIWKVRNRCL